MQPPNPDAVYVTTLAVWAGVWGTVEAYKAWLAKRRQQAVNMPAAKQSDTTVATLTKNTERDMMVKQRLAVLLDHIGAIRCYIAKFHNGEHFVDGSDLLKVSRTHEVVRPFSGIAGQVDTFQSINVSSVPEEMALLLQDGPSFTVTEKIPEGRFRFMVKEGGSTAIVRVGIYKNGTPIGYLGADFTDTNEPDNILLAVSFAKQIQGMLQQ